MDLLFLFIIIPLTIIIGSFFFFFLFLYIGALISSALGTLYFYLAWYVLSGMGRPNGGKAYLSIKNHWEEFLIFWVCYLSVFMLVALLKAKLRHT